MATDWTPPISDAAVEKATGKTWPQWRADLDDWADGLDHPSIARTLREERGLSGWWSQMVSGTWEMMTGRRDPHQRAGVEGKYQASGSKTITAPPAAVDAAFELPDFAEWGPGGVFTRTSGTPGKSINGHWSQGGRLSVWLTVRDGETGNKTQISLSHENLETAEDCEHWKSEWRAALARLKERLEG
ncbi:hypothetical protein [Maricaulis maris]|uniref:hypothetical protein n=1 Tax=Maricaulis maris TaxID=74318 RepID=UPI0026F1F948|nr:hypothetical protein [Maricaulis maris]